MSSTIKISSVTQMSNGEKIPALEFVRKYKDLAAAVSKATPTADRVNRDANGDRKIGAPDYSSMISVHRTISRRNKDAKMVLQMLPDLKLAIEMVISLIMSPKDMISDEVVILSDSSDLLPASILSSMTNITSEYFRKNHNISEFLQRMLYEVCGLQGALPTIIIPENALDDLINNYNANLSLESFGKEFDLESNIPVPYGMLGSPDYLTDQTKKVQTASSGSGRMKFGSKVSFDLQSYETYRSMNVKKATTANAGMKFSLLMPKEGKDGKNEPWVFKPIGSDQEVNADDLVTVTDNFSVLKMPVIREMALESRVSRILTQRGGNKMQASLEGLARKFVNKHKTALNQQGSRDLSDPEVEKLLFKNRRFAHTPVAAVRNNSMLKRNSIGEPLIRELDTSCFIPLSIEGDPTRKLGGYIMLDEEGYPLTTHNPDPEEIVDLSTYAGGSGNFISSMNDRSNSIMNGKDCNTVPQYMLRKFFTRATGEMIEKDLIDRAKNGQYDNGVQLGNNEDFFWLMVTRCMKGQRTTLLWIPNEFLVYFALDFDEMGFGKSMLDDVRNITSMRIMLMVAGIAASLRNSIGRTKVTVKLDEEDQDAEKTIEDIQDEILKSRMNPIPFGINNVADISKYLQRACYEFEITGSTAIPDMQIGFEQFNTNYPKPDEDLQNQLKELSYHHVGVTKDMIDAADTAEFAIQAATSNLMTMKRIQRLQRKVIPQASEYIRKIATNSEHQFNALTEVLKNNFKNMQVDKLKKYFDITDDKLLEDEDFKNLVIGQCLNVYLNNLYIELPSPAATTLEAQKAQFDDVAEFYKSALEYVVNESFFDTSIMGEGQSDHVEMIKNILLSHLMREWMAKNGVLPELSDLTTVGEDGRVASNVMDSLEKHIKALGMSTENFFKRFRKFAGVMTVLMQDTPEGSTTGETDTGGGSSGDSDDGDLGGGSDFDIPTDDENPDDENPDENENDDDENQDENQDENSSGVGDDIV